MIRVPFILNTPLRIFNFTNYTVFRVDRITFFLVNRVENQNEPKRSQSGGRLGSFWFSTRPTAMGGTDYNGIIGQIEKLLLKLSHNPSAL